MGSFKCVPKHAHWTIFLDKRVLVTPTVVTKRIINETIKELSIPIFAVPRIYSDELKIENKRYLTDFFKKNDNWRQYKKKWYKNS